MTLPPWHRAPGQLNWVYRFLLLTRLLVAVFFSGYVHPDEFFQSSEIGARDVLKLHVFTPWEFGGNTHSGIVLPGEQLGENIPCRSITFPVVSSYVPYLWIDMLHKFWFGISAGDALQSTPPVESVSKHTFATLLLLLPRIWTWMLSIASDTAVRNICAAAELPEMPTLVLWSMQWTVLLFHTRTFSNTFELFWLTGLTYFACKMTSPSLYTPARATHGTSFVSGLGFGLAAAIASFTRPTILAFAFPVGLFLLHAVAMQGEKAKQDEFPPWYQMGRRQYTRVLVCGLATVLGLLVGAASCVTIDTLYFKHLFPAAAPNSATSTSVVGWPQMIIAPLNWLRFNWETENVRQFGIHPHWLHLLVNMQILFGPLFVVLVINLCRHRGAFLFRNAVGSHARVRPQPFRPTPDTGHQTGRDARGKRGASFPGLVLASAVGGGALAEENVSTVPTVTPISARAASLRVALLGSVGVGLAVLSVSNHQEARFLLPATLGVVLLSGLAFTPREDGPVSNHGLPRALGATLVVFNVALLLFYGTVHQAGVVPSLLAHHQDADSFPSQQHHLIYFAGYMPPQSLLLQPRASIQQPTDNLTTSGGSVHIHDFSSAESVDAFRTRFSAFKRAYDAKYSQWSRHPNAPAEQTELSKRPLVTLVASRSAMTTELRSVLRMHGVERIQDSRCHWPHFSGEFPPRSMEDMSLCHYRLVLL
eukprot:m.1031438 g.1031438  ORF g.1031438 m.1031438 type:complete len:705 (+) comp24122_c0_seq11:414-2528(+)